MLLYPIIGKLFILNPVSPYSSFSFSFYKYLSLLFSYWSVPSSSCSSIGFNCVLEFSGKLYIRAEFSIFLRMVHLVVQKLQYAFFLICILDLYNLLSNLILLCLLSFISMLIFHNVSPVRKKDP